MPSVSVAPKLNFLAQVEVGQIGPIFKHVQFRRAKCLANCMLSILEKCTKTSTWARKLSSGARETIGTDSERK